MSIKKSCESWHRADISLHSRPLKAHSWARQLPHSLHFILLLFYHPPCLPDFFLSLSRLNFFPFRLFPCALSLPTKLLLRSRTWRRSWSWIGGVCLRLRGWPNGQRRSWQWRRRGCCCRRTSCKAEQVVVQSAARPSSSVWNIRNAENQLSSRVSIIHWGSVLIRFLPHGTIIYTENETDVHYLSSTVSSKCHHTQSAKTNNLM